MATHGILLFEYGMNHETALKSDLKKRNSHSLGENEPHFARDAVLTFFDGTSILRRGDGCWLIVHEHLGSYPRLS